MVNKNFLQKKKLCQEDIEDKDRPGKRSEIPLMFEWTSLLLRANSNTECAGTTLVPSFPSFPQTCFVVDNVLSVERTKQYIYDEDMFIRENDNSKNLDSRICTTESPVRTLISKPRSIRLSIASALSLLRSSV